MEFLKRRLRAIDERLSQHSWYRIGRNAYQGFNRAQGSRKAAAITYFAIFSLFSFILLLIALLGFLLNSAEAQQQVISLFSVFLPTGSTGVQQVIDGAVQARGAAAGVGIVLLLLGALGWFESIDQALNEIWSVRVSRPFVKGKLFALSMILGIALVMGLSWLASIAVSFFQGLAGNFGLNTLPGSKALWEVAVWAVSLGLIFVMFLLLYRFSPMCGLSWGKVWRGALIAAVLWSVVRSLFSIYVTHFANYSSAYGPIGAVIALLTWLYFAHMIILFGASLTYAMELDTNGVMEYAPLPCAIPEGQPPEGRRRLTFRPSRR